MKESKQTIHYIYFIFSCYYVTDYIADLIKKLELCLTVVSVLLKIRFEHAQSSVPKISISMLKTALSTPDCCLKNGTKWFGINRCGQFFTLLNIGHTTGGSVIWHLCNIPTLLHIDTKQGSYCDVGWLF